MFNRYQLIKRLIVTWVTPFMAMLILALASPVPSPLWAEAKPSQTNPGSFAGLVKKVSPSVVNISVVKVVKGRATAPMPFGPDDPFRDFFEKFFGGQLPEEFKQKGLGTGFIIEKDGFILTNNHVVESADEIKVRMTDDKEFVAKIVGRDPKTDLALIKINPETPLSPIPLGDSDKLQAGDWVVAIGNPFGLGNTVTAGIVSAKYRQIGAGAYDNFIQTDASINPGNSGGPLLNTNGEVIGINSAIFSQSGGSIGIGFAIPINMAKDLLPQLKAGKVVRGWLGVMIQPVTPELKDKLKLKDEKGALVADVTPAGPADKAGLRRGDVIISFDGKEIKESSDLPFIVAKTLVGKVVNIEVMRKGEKKNIQVKIVEAKEEQTATREMGKSEKGARLGMRIEQLTPEIAAYFGISETTGLVVVDVAVEGSAAEAGLQPGDLIIEVDQVPVKELSEFGRKISSYKSGDTALFLVKRQGATMYMTLKVEK